MKWIFTIGVLWLVYIYAGYAIVLLAAGWRRRVDPARSEAALPTASVLIAARNEEKDIGWKISETLAWNYPAERLEVLVASDASDDRTDEIVCNFGDPRVALVRMKTHSGKARALNRLAEFARGEILFFTDANAQIGPEALRRMARHFANPRVGCVTGDSRPIAEKNISSGAGAYWSYECFLKSLESRIGSVLVCDGAIFCMRAKLFRTLSPELANDLELPARVATAGYWITHEPRAIVFERDTESPRQEFNRRRRICAQGALAISRRPGILTGFRGWQFTTHKLLRWLSLIPMMMIFIASAALVRESRWFVASLATQLAFYALAAAGLAGLRGRIFAIPFYIVLGVAGAMAGVVESLLGKRFDIWEIPTMSRGLEAD